MSYKKNIEHQQGFTLIELMIVIAIIGVLAAIAVPQYTQYSKKAKFSEVVTASNQLKSAVNVCVTENSSISACDTFAKLGIDPVKLTTHDTIDNAEIAASTAEITLTGHAQDLNGATYVITPSYDNTQNTLTWSVSGTCKLAATNYC